jgi:putative adhesin
MSWSARLVPAVFAAALAAGGCVDIFGADVGRYVEREEKHFSVTGRPDVSVRTFDGSIEIRPWDRPEVQVVIEKRGRNRKETDAIEVKAEQSGNHVEVVVSYPPMHGFGIHVGGRSAKLIVSMPASSDVVARSGDGSIDVDGMAGHIRLQSGDGSIRARQVSGDLDVHTGDGSVTLTGRLTSVHARSGDGSVTIRADEGSTAESDWDIVTGDGSVTLAIPDGFGAELDAHTGDGGIHMQDLIVSNVTGRIGRSSLRGRLGDGGHNLRVRTGDGSITLKRS